MLITLAVAGLSSCEDYLTITPTNKIVEEEFWEDKNDLKNALTACYLRLTRQDLMEKYIQWGEARGDNFEKRTGVNNTDMQNVMNANLISTNSMFDWTGFYNCINYCNKVLAHGPDIVSVDETFSNGDWQPMKAEAMTIRALCHYWLVRTFGDVPYVAQDFNNDSQDFVIGQRKQIEVLDSIIEDLEIAKDIAMVDYGNTVENKGRITRKAVYALLADVYLWRASYKEGNPEEAAGGSSALQDYQKCVEYCDYVINTMIDDYTTYIKKSGLIIGGLTQDLTLEDLLYQNVASSNSVLGGVMTSLSSTTPYNAIFGTGNSHESIFELQFDSEDNVNNMELSMFWDASKSIAGTLVCSSALMSGIDTNPNSALPGSIFTKTDYRRWTTSMFTKADQTEYPLAKYNLVMVSQYNGTTTNGMRDNTLSNFIYESSYQGTHNSANWIFYRITDVMLMKAEAMVQISDDEENLHNAFMLVREVFKRSNPYAYQNTTSATDSLNFDNFNNRADMTRLVLSERQREFVGEGKRWFDLVRYAQRNGSTVDMLKLLVRKYTDNQKAIEAKLASLKSLFSPIYTNEIKNNPLLQQNDVWGTSESTSKTDDL